MIIGKILILSDGKPGHYNQSIAFARHLEQGYELVQTDFRWRFFKVLSYVFDRLGIYYSGLFRCPALNNDYCAIVCTGSGTYYAGKALGRKLAIPVAAIMLPRGYRLDFDLIVAQEHDFPPRQSNILSLPVNLNYLVPKGLISADPENRYIALIVGGNNNEFIMESEALERIVVDIFGRFPQHRIMVATSRRTPSRIEEMLDNHPFARKFFYSHDPENPIPDLLSVSEYVFITADSTSMISEAVCFGCACVEVIPLRSRRETNKFLRMTKRLEDLGCLHIYDGEVGNRSAKIDISDRLKGIGLCA